MSIDKSIYQQHDIQHVQEKFPHAPEYISERLGRAISARRQYLTYREEHHQKLAKGIEKLGYEKPTTEFTTNSTEATRMKSSKVLEEDDDDIASQTSYATSVNATIRVPSLPKEALKRQPFECPLCFSIVSIYNASAWKKHVYMDLFPYCCTYEHCTIADRLYDSRRSWFAHELEAHRTSWQCIEGCSKECKTELDFESHVHKAHPELASKSMFSALKRTSAIKAHVTDVSTCVLCAKKMSLRALQRHLGSHQQQLALFAAPPNLDETEDDPDQVDVDSMAAGNPEQDELSDISDITDEEEIHEVDQGDSSDSRVSISRCLLLLRND